MSRKRDGKLLGIPLLVWGVQFLYVVAALAILIVLLQGLDIAFVSLTVRRIVAIAYIVVMVGVDILWRIFVTKKKILLFIFPVFVVVFGCIAVAQFSSLQHARSSLQNYYKFRGCIELISQSDTSALCNIASGETISIIKYQNAWYQQSDLPSTDYKSSAAPKTL